LISKLNWRLIAVHVIASWLFMHGFMILSYLHNIPVYEELQHAFDENRYPAVDVTELSSFPVWLYVTRTLGAVAAFGISLAIAYKRKWYLLNSILVFILIDILSWLNLLGWEYLKEIFLMMGQPFKNTSVRFSINGLVLLSLGLLLFLSPKINHWIQKNTEPRLTL
jgi:hypothetical protein